MVHVSMRLPLPSPSEPKSSPLESEIRALRPSLERGEPAKVRRLLFALLEAATHHVHAGALADARRAIGDAVIVLESEALEGDAVALARGSLLLGELLFALDAPVYAKARLGRALGLFEAAKDAIHAGRAKLALARTLVVLDDPLGVVLLGELRVEAERSGDVVMIGAVLAASEEAKKVFDTPRTVRTGYGRPVSLVPPSA